MTIWKYALEMTDRQFVSMPEGATLLSVANQRGALCLWALVDPDNPGVMREINIVGTGNPMTEDETHFIGSVVIEPFVWHVFEIVT